MFGVLRSSVNVARSLEPIPKYLSRPVDLVKEYDRSNLRPDLIAGLTTAVILLPQAIAFALIAELPPEMGVYTAIVGAIVGALWGSSNQTHTGPTNTMSLLVLSTLITRFVPGSDAYILAAGLLAIMAGAFQLLMGLARLGVMVNFVSHSVIVGFATGAGALIAVRQIGPLLGLQFVSHGLINTLAETWVNLQEIDPITTALGLGTILLIVVLGRLNPKLPGALIAMVSASIVVYVFGLAEAGVAVIGELPRQLPPLTDLTQFDLAAISTISSGALAIAAIGLVETVAISRSIATQTGQRLDSNQEFVGQGLANIACGLFSGYACAGSFTRSAVNFNAGAKGPLAAVASVLFLLIAMLALSPLAAYLPRTALAGVLIVVSTKMIDREEINRIWEGSRGDAFIMLFTFLATIFLDLAFAVLFGILLSFALYILRTSTPRVHQVQPDEQYKHFAYRPDRPVCPQLGVVDILGDLYFGAVSHVEDTLQQYLETNPEQRFLLIRLHNVNQCDFSGIHMLESVVRTYRERGGDIFVVGVGFRVNRLMTSTGFYDKLGWGNLLHEDKAISRIFYRVLDPAVCIYECPYRVFKECQNLPKQIYHDDIAIVGDDGPGESIHEVAPEEVWESLRQRDKSIQVIDVREPREFKRGHIPGAELVPLPKILSGQYQHGKYSDCQIVFVCRSGRRSRRAAQAYVNDGYKVMIVRGGMIAWEAAGLLEAVD